MACSARAASLLSPTFSAASASYDNALNVTLQSSTSLQLLVNNNGPTWTFPSVADGQWHHFAVTRDAGSGQSVLYIDGQSQGAKSVATSTTAVDPAGLFLGQDQDTIGGLFDPTQSVQGTLDELSVPQRSILFRERDQLGVRSRPCGTTRVGQQHKRE